MGYLVNGPRVVAELSHHFLTLETRDGKDGILVLLPPRAIIVEIPDGGVDVLGLV